MVMTVVRRVVILGAVLFALTPFASRVYADDISSLSGSGATSAEQTVVSGAPNGDLGASALPGGAGAENSDDALDGTSSGDTESDDVDNSAVDQSAPDGADDSNADDSEGASDGVSDDSLLGTDGSSVDGSPSDGAIEEQGVDVMSASDAARSVSGWHRMGGANALGTMQLISQQGWSSSKTAVLATNMGYWDALSANSLAGALGAPVLLTTPWALSSETSQELKRLGVSEVYICGGTAAVSSHVENQLKSMGCTVRRVWGAHQNETAIEVARLVRSIKPSTTFIVATSMTYHDAMAIAPYSYANAIPIITCANNSLRLDNNSLSFIRNGGYKNAVIVGGTAAVDGSVESSLSGIGIPSERLSGATAFETSQSIANYELSHGMTLGALGVATGDSFHDALTGAALCGKNNNVMILVATRNRVTLTDFLSSHRGEIAGGYVFGGTEAISNSVYNTLQHCWKNGYSSDYATDEEAPYKAIYNYEFYRSKYADVKNAFGNDRQATLNHFLNTGRREKRQGCAGFDVQSYYNQYEDLRRAFGVNWPAYYDHFVKNGSREGRAGTGCTSLKGNWQYHNIAWAGQPTNYHCAPTCGYMVLRNLGVSRSASSGRGLSIWTLGEDMHTTPWDGTLFHPRHWANAMNAWLGKNAYKSIRMPNGAQTRQAISDSFKNGYAVVTDAAERYGGPHYNGHSNGTYAHAVVVDAYNKNTGEVYMLDPGAGTVWPGAQRRFHYGNIDDFANKYLSWEIDPSDGKEHTGIHAPR